MRTSRSLTFRARTLPHVDAVYADALCLTGRRDEAADLVVAAYARAFQEWGRCGSERLPASPGTGGTLAWLFGHLHGAFCDEILARAAKGGRS